MSATRTTGSWTLSTICRSTPRSTVRIPRVHREMGIKPAGLVDVGGTLYFAVETQNYGTEPLSTARPTSTVGL